MARVELSSNVTLSGARRVLSRRKSSFALTLRNGKVYTYRKNAHTVQPNSAAQLNARSLLIQANTLAREDLLRPGRREYWLARAKATNYKTPIGCARAYYISLLKSRSSQTETSSLVTLTTSIPKLKPLSSHISIPPHRPSHSQVIQITRKRSRLLLSGGFL